MCRGSLQILNMVCVFFLMYIFLYFHTVPCHTGKDQFSLIPLFLALPSIIDFCIWRSKPKAVQMRGLISDSFFTSGFDTLAKKQIVFKIIYLNLKIELWSFYIEWTWNWVLDFNLTLSGKVSPSLHPFHVLLRKNGNLSKNHKICYPKQESQAQFLRQLI